MSEEQEFWNEFAAEYAEIQQESQITIAEDLAIFLKKNEILPISSFVDLAAGSGRYIPALLPETEHYLAIDFSVEMLKEAKRSVKDPQQKVELRLQTQAEFLADKTKYPLIFTAMNPALTEKRHLLSLVEKSDRLLVLRIVRNQENLFQPLEQSANKEEKLLSVYKKWLLEEQISFSTQLFPYTYEEVIDRSFFCRYFQQDIPQSKLQLLIHSLFGEKDQVISKTEIDYELLII